MTLNVEILTPSQVLLKGQAESLVAPAIQGEVEILPNHTDYLTLLGEGRLILKNGSNAQGFTVKGGVLTIAKDSITVLVDQVLES
ncbi:MAG: hypothetical protein A3G32_09180 [Deltaproteobacteria bacterium RIFCSPLOWO2_12_FULL_40_28]|nr:MAG: hypothetical protein A3C45_08035 [Deltaproteobacteria bacterium RIFCSPHIGHO2_02_FULL_40_28]OGQ21193.1 MAG: hypothetical protein A3E27_01670 [Deltaproteobacteria bacterium RIFCSPHIGHO2_12_FULL_40_32]OGQ39094.1 MAG: hypothetical protein A3I69_09305 [Deltaproteobacteria bacterium RIFCSPLOWO2_02_FULL_40_36]OGQ53167.1 MAG: hypothetical protein A3G32_09180 [Deltaproteobacteria bacterium RIFCSPLOWO2_12_FULL_40_28]